MDTRTVLAKVVTLIYKSRLLGNLDNDDLIRTVLDTIKTDSPEFNFLGNSVKAFKDTCLSLLSEETEIPREVILQQISIVLENDAKLLNVVKESIDQDTDEASNKRILISLVKNLKAYYREYVGCDVLSKASYDLKFNRGKIGSFTTYLQNVIQQLEPLASSMLTAKDPAIVSEVDFESTDSVETVFEEVRSLNGDSGVYRFGWQAINEMSQGGGRRGESIGLNALQHKYKTGGSLSLFMQVPLFNKPIVTPKELEEKRKPLLLRISFEDNLTNNLQFMYQYLKASVGIKVAKKDFLTLTAKEMTEFIIGKLTSTGFHIKMMRVDPSQWTYASVVNKVIELEAEGYAVHLCMIDYLLKMPTTGCIQGAMGADKRDLVRRTRNFMSARNIMFISPFQLSSEAKQLLRNGIQEHQFVNEVAERGYYDGCKSIDQELDLEIFLHCFTHKRMKFLAFRRGKHRLPNDIPEEKKYCMYKFTDILTPVLHDLDGPDTSFVKLPKEGFSNGEDDLLGEIL